MCTLELIDSSVIIIDRLKLFVWQSYCADILNKLSILKYMHVCLK